MQQSPTPIVGLTAGRADARWGPWSGGAVVLAEEYVTAVERAGAAARDACEIALVRAAFERDLPVLATCRGMQVMNVAFGGTLRQHLPGRKGERHRRREGEFTRHPVLLTAGSLAARVAGEERHVVDSHHHQAVDLVASNFLVSGHADDGVIEALEDPSRVFALGVQWHPEVDEASGLIAALVAELATRHPDQQPGVSSVPRR